MPGGALFARYPASAESIGVAGDRLGRTASPLRGVLSATEGAQRAAVTHVDGSIVAPMSAAGQPVRTSTSTLVRSAYLGRGALRLFAGHVATFDAGIDDLNARWAQGQAGGFGVAAPTLAADATAADRQQAGQEHAAAVDVARAGLLAELRAAHHRLEGDLDAGARSAASVLDEDPDDDVAAVVVGLAMAAAAAAVGAGAGRPSLDDILRRYQTAIDPEGVVEWPRHWPATWLTDQRQTVTETEADMLDDLGLLAVQDFKGIYDDSFGTADDRYPSEDRNDDHNDAFRHTYWNALMARRFGQYWAESYGTAHEGLEGNAAVREAMDLYNNEVGRRIAEANPDADEDELADLVQQAVEDGEVLVIDANGNLAWSDHVDPQDTGDASQLPPAEGDGELDEPDPDADPDSHNDGGTGS